MFFKALYKPVVGLLWQSGELRLHLAGQPGAADDAIDAKADAAGGVAVQLHYLAELLDELVGKHVRLDATSAGAPLLVTDPDDADFLVVQMPCRAPSETSQAA